MIKRIFVEKKEAISTQANNLKDELNLQLKQNISHLRTFLRYDVQGVSDDDFAIAVKTVFSEPPVDDVYFEDLPELSAYEVFAVEYLPGQYDVRADSAAQCVQLLTMGERPDVRCATVYAVKGATDIKKIKGYLINPVDSRLALSHKPKSLKLVTHEPEDVKTIAGFCGFNESGIADFKKQFGLAMSVNDILFAQKYFILEGRDPTETEIRVLDSYWSDHCRHTTFLTELEKVEFDTEVKEIEESYKEYKKVFEKHNKNRSDKYECFMDMATIAVKELKSRGLLKDIDVSEEINACSIRVKAKTSEGDKDYLVMFKNETHNHPTEIEPFGGAATCLGGAIRDPLAGRAYVYHSMRITGAADITEPVDKTIAGKLPQRIITKEAARGFSSYGNQIGLAAGIIHEIFHEGFKAKRMEAGFVVGAAEQKNVIRKKPAVGDIILLIGGETGRDGCGGAVGSSKEHKIDSIETCGAEVQKGDPVMERKIQRLYRNPDFARKVKRCNDFGAGGVCVAIGEIADGLDINLDAVPKKYEGLTGTELAISESQERMAVVVAKEDFDEVIRLAAEENLNAVQVATVTDTNRMTMKFRGKKIVDLSREFLSSNGAKQTASAKITDKIPNYMTKPSEQAAPYLKDGKYTDALAAELKRLNVASNKGMAEMFDSTIGAATVYMPFGGVKQLTPVIAMAAKLPVYPLDTSTATVASWGYDPYLMSQSPYVGAMYSVLLSVAKVVATGAPYEDIYLTFQEYFKALKDCPERWGEPAAALLGALQAQLKLGLAAIGGKDSMSGTFIDIDVPPTLISFAIAAADAGKLITNVLEPDMRVYRLSLVRSSSGAPDVDYFAKLMRALTKNIEGGKIKFSTVVEAGGAVAAVAKSCFGNGLGFEFDKKQEDLFYPLLGDILVSGDISGLKDFAPEYIGKTNQSAVFCFECDDNADCVAACKKDSDGQCKDNNDGNDCILADTLIDAYLSTLNPIFPIASSRSAVLPSDFDNVAPKITYKPYGGKKIARPSVLIPVFPGTNCEYDTAKKFIDAGADVNMLVFKNRSSEDVKTSAKELAAAIGNAQIIAIPGGFSAGDEPDGSGKFIATVFRSPEISDQVMKMLEVRDGLMLGICNGFQSLIKLGLLPYGKIMPMTDNSPTLYFNTINRHVSTLSRVMVSSTDSPWLSNVKVGDVFLTAMSHGEGRIIADPSILESLKSSGRICTQYVDEIGVPTAQSPDNPNGSMYAIEGLISPCGKILGKMGHVERINKDLYKNVEGAKEMDIFGAGVNYFR